MTKSAEIVTDRDGAGRFQPGNQVSRGNGHPSLKKLMDLRAAYLSAVTPEKVAEVEASMFALATSEPDSRVRLAACVEYLNRVYGRPKEWVEIDLSARTDQRVQNVPDLSIEEVEVLDKIVRRSQPALPAAESDSE